MRPGTRWALGGVIVVSVHAAAAVYFHFVNPYESQIFPPCLWHRITGLQCPTCGGTRALYSLLAGDFLRSFAMNPLLLASYVSGGLVVGQAAFESATGRQGRWPIRLALGLVFAAWVYTGILRNLL
ncbi:DUF2752 domain-containing protein [Microbacterium sp. LWO12-1.2]|uniref:DUF2752 domain-containing protein n=1 Tax=Microbacterium sp. LWO12-1.2 TaxID=3135261 RepID=UPI00344ACEE2